MDSAAGRPVPVHASGGGYNFHSAQRHEASTVGCKRSAGPLTRRQRNDAHRIEMQSRRERQRARVPGFTPVANERVNRACQAAFIALKIQNPNLSTFEAQEEAVKQAARNLPPPRRVFDWRQGAVSKNNDPAYRKAFVRELPRRWLPIFTEA